MAIQTAEEVKPCSSCREVLPLDAFYRRSDGKGSGVQSHCKACSRAAHARWRADNQRRIRELGRAYTYGLTPEQFDRMVLEQGNRCGLCDTDLGDVPQVDHDHTTGKVRALLCRRCNSALGAFGDNADRLEAAASYIRSHQEG